MVWSVNGLLAADTLFVNYDLSEHDNLRMKVARISSPADVVLFYSQKYFESSIRELSCYIYL